jgi:hypothetical protein
MDKKLIKEDIANMRYLLGYKAGKVISEQEQPEIDEYFYGDIEDLGKKHPERLVKHRDTGKLVGSHKKGEGFRPSPHGEELGFEHHPMDIPKGTRFGGTEIGDFDYEDDDFNFSSDEEMFEGYEYDDVDELNPDDFNDDEQSRVNDLKQKHGIKFRGDFDGDDDEWMDYMSDNRYSFDNFSKENKRTKISTDPIVFDPTDDETSQLKQRHGVKFRDEFDGDDEFMDYIHNNRDSFDNLSKDLNNLRQTKRNR